MNPSLNFDLTLFTALEYFLPEDKRKGPDHVFLRWETYFINKLAEQMIFLDLDESCNNTLSEMKENFYKKNSTGQNAKF